jgi:hypothetical protein
MGRRAPRPQSATRSRAWRRLLPQPPSCLVMKLGSSFRGRVAESGIQKRTPRISWIPGSALTGSPGMTALDPPPARFVAQARTSPRRLHNGRERGSVAPRARKSKTDTHLREIWSGSCPRIVTSPTVRSRWHALAHVRLLSLGVLMLALPAPTRQARPPHTSPCSRLRP